MSSPETIGRDRARRRFEAIASQSDASIDLTEAALWLSAEAYPLLDVAGCIDRIAALAARAEASVAMASSERARVEALNHALFVEEGFCGNRVDYYDPRNSFLNEVVERRSGIPITLSVLYVDVAQRLGLHAAGVGFPGHFLCKVVGSEELIVDAFGGTLLSRSQCQTLLRNVMGPDAQLDASHFAAAGNKATLARILTNLKQVYLSQNAYEEALGCCDRLLLLAPDAPLELRDRGLVLARLECPIAAIADLERFLQLAPHHDSVVSMHQTLEILRQRARRLH